MSGGIVPTQHPFLYTVSLTATEGTPLDALEDVVLKAMETVRTEGVTPQELAKAKTQLRARLVFEQDSVSNIAHQLGFFATIADWRYFPSIPARIDAVTLEDVATVAAARFAAANRIVGRFEPYGK